jgi:type II secretory pathway predicted ATPase ExeA
VGRGQGSSGNAGDAERIESQRSPSPNMGRGQGWGVDKMYENYYGLKERPFRKTPDPRYLFLNNVYEEALEQLLYAVEEMELALLTGEVGSGKTLLSRALIDRLSDKYEIGMILNPRLSPRQFLRTVASELGIEAPRFHASDLLEQIHDRLLALDEAGRAALLVVDEAHLIPGKATFEEIRLLTNFQLDDRNLIAVVLIGQSELRDRLRHRAYRALTQRIGAQFHLTPLDEAGTRAYVEHRLRIAGAEGPLFTSEALARLHSAASGIPRVVNHLATQALIEGMARGVRRLDAAVIEAVVEEHGLMIESSRAPAGAARAGSSRVPAARLAAAPRSVE